MKKILIVDDDKDFLVAIKYFLVKNGYETSVTSTCDEAVKIFYSFLPDLLLLDVNVGSEDGRVICKKIKSEADFNHIPIILISANDQALRAYRDYGADATITKPFEFSHLLTQITSYI